MRTLILIKKISLIAAGMLCIVLGVIGIFVPLLPTVPFLLLAAYCFARSSEKFYTWLFTNRWSGKILTDYKAGKGFPLSMKVSSILFLWLVLGYSILHVFQSTLWKAILFLVGLAVTVHLLMLKSYRKGE